ncbi:MAG TPA: GAF domain-containing protein, partial [Methylomirabilota bacterium]|nr:GAF domain-containing protein [Methylomirabilota bacterium]
MRLHEASATIFALSAILPLLIFLFVVSESSLLERTEVQVGLFLAVVVAVGGFLVFRRLVAHLAELPRSLQAGLVGRAVAPPAGAGASVPGLGPVAEIGEIAQTFGRMLEELRLSTSRLEDLVFKLGTLNDMVEMAAKIPKVEDLLAHVLDRTMRAVSAGIGSIMLLDAERRTLRVAVGRGLAQEAGGVEVRVGEGIAGKVVEQGEAVLVEDIEKDPRFG